MSAAGGDVTGLAGVTVVGDDGTPVLSDVTVLAGRTELLAIIGPSGSGKSTVLRTVAGLVRVAGGEVLVAGRPVNGVPTHERRLAMVFESGALLPFLDVAGNLTEGMRIRHESAARIEERLVQPTRLLGLGRILRRRPAGLSAGERGLVAVGRATIDVPAAYLFDEPLAHLDAPGRMHTRRAIVEMVRTAGVPALYVTHDQAEALALADRVAVLRAGSVVQTGTGRELYERPVDLFVAGFVGSPAMGLLPARLVESDGMAGFVVEGRTLPLWAPVPDLLRGWVGRDVVIGLRPDSVAPCGGADTVGLDGAVVAVDQLGPVTDVTVAVDSSPVLAPGADPPAGPRAWLPARFPAHARVRPGDRVRIAVDPTRAHVFDPDTGRALWHPASDRPPPVSAG